jgi:hypothetical protein
MPFFPPSPGLSLEATPLLPFFVVLVTTVGTRNGLRAAAPTGPGWDDGPSNPAASPGRSQGDLERQSNLLVL